MARIKMTVPLNGENAVKVGGLWQGLKPVLTVPDDEDPSPHYYEEILIPKTVQKGGFLGWVDLVGVSSQEEMPSEAEVYVETSQDKLVKMASEKKDAKYVKKISLGGLQDAEAQAKHDELPVDNRGD